jgi:arylsulfatase
MSSEWLNILLVVVEGARPDHLSHAGYERDTTPFLDQVAREGVRFTHAFTAAPGRPSGIDSEPNP